MRSDYYSKVDKAYMLWAMCLLDLRKKNNLSTSEYSIEQDYGKDAAKKWRIYGELAELHGWIDSWKMTLTPRGQRIVDNWKKHEEGIFAL